MKSYQLVIVIQMETLDQNSTMEKLDELKLAFDENGTVTAATSSPLTDGAAATLICEENYARENNLNILGRIVSTAVEGCDPDYMGLGPIGASKKALKRANLSAEQIDIVELNEAFASQSLACIKDCLLYTSPSPRDRSLSRMPSSA